MVGGTLIDEKGRNIPWNMGKKLGTGLIREYDSNREVSWVAEGFIAVRKELFDVIGGFDEWFFMTGEGPDLSERMRKRGFKTYFVKDAVVDLRESHTHPRWKRKIWSWMQFPKFYFKHGFR